MGMGFATGADGESGALRGSPAVGAGGGIIGLFPPRAAATAPESGEGAEGVVATDAGTGIGIVRTGVGVEGAGVLANAMCGSSWSSSIFITSGAGAAAVAAGRGKGG